MFFEHNEELVVFRQAYEKACTELGIGSAEADKDRREQLEELFLSLINAGDADPEAVRANIQLRLCSALLGFSVRSLPIPEIGEEDWCSQTAREDLDEDLHRAFLVISNHGGGPPRLLESLGVRFNRHHVRAHLL